MNTGIRPARRSADMAQIARAIDALIERAPRRTVQAPLRRMTSRMYDPEELSGFRALWKDQSGDGAANVRRLLEQLNQRPADWALSPPPADSALCDLAARYPNFGAAVATVRRSAALGRLMQESSPVIPPLLLNGPPGVGKTQFANELAHVLGVPLLQFNLAHATASFSLAGTDTQYASGGPGFLLRSVVGLGVPDLLVLVDEIDKAASNSQSNPVGPLYALLERGSARWFIDDGFRLPMNLGHLRWICTCNDAALVDAPIRSRCQELLIAPPTKDQMRIMVREEYRRTISENGLQPNFAPVLDDIVIDALADLSPRSMKLRLMEALGNAALEGRASVTEDDLPSMRPRNAMGFVA
jgi:ATP-dependent Lon protease